MAVIQVEQKFITQINVFTVEPANQQSLIDRLQEAAEFASRIPGWVSASIHRSLDGTRVVNYAQSKDMESAQRIIDALRKAGFFDRNAQFGEAHPGLYEVAITLGS
jgi:Antibiotic biosynthesis monooxygenase